MFSLQVFPPRSAGICAPSRRFASVFILAAAALFMNRPLRGQPRQQTAAAVPVIAAPQDISYPGAIRLQVDATDVTHRIYKVHETIPVPRSGPITLLYPQWTSGDHAPNGPIDKFAGLTLTAAGRRLHWQRDPMQVYAFHVDVPSGATSLDLDYQYIGSTDPTTGSILINSRMLDLQWQDVILYPAGYYVRDLTYRPSITLPTGWKFASALDGAQAAGDSVNFAAVTLETLLDSPVLAGRFFKQIPLSDDPVPVHLDIVADDESGLDLAPEAVAGYRNVVTQAYKLFGAHHYDHYDILVWLSDDFGPAYYEHHRCGENSAPASLFHGEWADTLLYRTIFAHGFVHSWNGMFRIPAGMATPDVNTPQQTQLFWIFEGLTSYWQDVLTARSGLWSTQEAVNNFGNLALRVQLEPGPAWRPLEDLNYEPLLNFRKPQSWPGWQRNLFDAYQQGELIWLDVDTLIRQQTAGKKSLDDFARLFFGQVPGSPDGSYAAAPYTLADMVSTLNQVMPYDWNSYLRTRLEAYTSASSLDGIQHGGYRIVYREQQSPYSLERERLTGGGIDLRTSIGLIVAKRGNLGEIVWDSPAFQAGILPGGGATITAVNDQPFTPEAIKSAIQSTKNGSPLKLTIKRGAATDSFLLNWKGGPRYPRIERNLATPALLDQILTPR